MVPFLLFGDESFARGLLVLPGDVDRFLPNGVQLTDGRRLEGYDVAVLATGYHTSYDWLPPDVQQRLQVQEDGMYLYRHIIPPLVPVRPSTFPSPHHSCGPHT
jgi:hypothetical protein